MVLWWNTHGVTLESADSVVAVGGDVDFTVYPVIRAQQSLIKIIVHPQNHTMLTVSKYMSVALSPLKAPVRQKQDSKSARFHLLLSIMEVLFEKQSSLLRQSDCRPHELKQ